MIATICLSTSFLQGCGASVDCNDKKTKKTAIEIIQSRLDNAVWYKEIGTFALSAPELLNIKTLARNDELKQCQCSGKYSFTYNGTPREIDVAYNLSYLQDKGETEVLVDVNSVQAGLMGIVMREAPRLSPEAQAEKNRLEKVQLQAKIKDEESGIANAIAETKLIEKFKVKVVSAKMAKRLDRGAVDSEMAFEVTNGTEYPIISMGYKMFVQVPGFKFSSAEYNSGTYDFAEPLKPGESLKFVVTNNRSNKRSARSIFIPSHVSDAYEGNAKIDAETEFDVQIKIESLVSVGGYTYQIIPIDTSYLEGLKQQAGRL